ncbi:Hypothetical protein I595_928 [Croceitalea dokdonensis DOKDO 023]|uniref:Uncharacterized protein n=1 Tax=Croceitalea dokdonensis DOKDO 023 TaxID=1300341 RepID=A0A0P7AWW6_9FLAO|nr:hypothetical protein [Croceitalea dokdonensis]KPM32510.1 Hypothetical protein I595_928 [Croceitalea dokdonensis DOKDO 023]
MPEEAIPPKYAFKGCFITGCSAVLIFVIVAVCYLVYTFYLDDSLPTG